MNLTRRAFRLAGIAPGGRLLDVGCGDGLTVDYAQSLALTAVGIDERAEKLPYGGGEFDAVVMECVLSVLENKNLALSEVFRVTAQGGRLIISDVYAKDDRAEYPSLEQYKNLLAVAGFRADVLETHDDALVNYCLEQGETPDRALGYFLAVAHKTTPLAEFERTVILEAGCADLRELQAAQLRGTIRRAQKTRFYGAIPLIAGVNPDTLTRENYIEILRSLPVTLPSGVTGRANDFLAIPPSEVARVVTARTSGTTGSAKRVFFDESDIARCVRFFDYGMRGIAKRRCFVAFPCETTGSVGDVLSRALRNIGVEPVPYGLIRDPQAALAALNASGADSVVGIPYQVRAMAAFGDAPSVQSVLLSSDSVPESLADFIKNRWNCRAFEHYGMAEICYGGAVDCADGSGMHIRENDLLIEITDESGAPLPDGTPGNIVITSLNGEAMPFLRYKTGDTGTILPGKCPCGCGFRRLAVQGRARAAEVAGAVVRLSELDEIVYKNEKIAAYSAAVRGDRLVLSVYPAVLWTTGDSDELADEICGSIAGLARDKTEIAAGNSYGAVNSSVKRAFGGD
ncbi:MAG: AMP-binding protein [Oscillospiraceae bacterium]|jgi:phenylacetate-coenzyme A ligase PaaK-like adenylate-forming protein|nr:AMP-binding protein [Oscillospiraceae bacterium]